jgi:predicted dehydrogenase
MAPIRVGIIGLSTTSDSTNWAANAHLPYLQKSDKYEVVALCNSSVDSAKKSIAQYKLPESTKAYGSPEDIAQDPDVDLVVNVTDVKRHYELILPSVKAGKNVYTELPLARNIDQCRELAQLAKEKKIKTMFGMQGQSHPVLNHVKKIIADGKIGKVLSTTIIGFAGPFGGAPLPTGFKGLLDIDNGASIVQVWFLHSK